VTAKKAQLSESNENKSIFKPYPAMTDSPSASFYRLTPHQAGLVKQAIKTAVASMGSLYASRFLKLPEGYWAVISAIIVMQSDLNATLKTSVNRLAGTAIGAIVGGICASLLEIHIWSLGIAVMAAILVCALLDRWESYRFAGVTVAIVMLASHNASHWTVALHRFAELSLGIVIALAVELTWR
jgi:uncharacterized membrane protein YgaE (UPF0421/DUF939 family)